MGQQLNEWPNFIFDSGFSISKWVNYKVGPYLLHHILIWSVTFHLCQFSP